MPLLVSEDEKTLVVCINCLTKVSHFLILFYFCSALTQVPQNEVIIHQLPKGLQNLTSGLMFFIVDCREAVTGGSNDTITYLFTSTF